MKKKTKREIYRHDDIKTKRHKNLFFPLKKKEEAMSE